MAIGHCKDVENGEIVINGLEDLEEPFIQEEGKVVSYQDEDDDQENNGGSVGMVLFSTFVAVCASFEFGSCVSTSLFLYLASVC